MCLAIFTFSDYSSTTKCPIIILFEKAETLPKEFVLYILRLLHKSIGSASRGIVKCGVWASSSFLFNSDPIFKLNTFDHVGKQLIAP